MAEPICHGEHSGHICVLASNKKFEEIKTLTQKPQFICFNCGRVADCKENLCNPMPLKERYERASIGGPLKQYEDSSAFLKQRR